MAVGDKAARAMRSMTGFGRSQREAHGVRAVVEVKSVNHKGLDVKVRLPRDAGQLESEIVQLVKGACERGRVDVSVDIVAVEPAARDVDAVQRMVHEARAIALPGLLPFALIADAKLVLTDRLIDATVPLSMEGAEEEIQITSTDEEEETH